MAPVKFGVGQSVLRKEDDALIRGKGRYTDDYAPSSALHALVLRSPHAHARLLSVDAVAARAMPGVLAVYTGATPGDASLPEITLADLSLPENPFLVIGEHIEKPGNLGTMLRTADAAGARERVRVYPHANDDVLAAIDAAREAGARVIVGPLVRDDLKALVASGRDLPVTIALNQLDEDRPIACLCHHGMRSLQVAHFLEQNGFTDIANVTGGIDLWSAERDPSVPRY